MSALTSKSLRKVKAAWKNLDSVWVVWRKTDNGGRIVVTETNTVADDVDEVDGIIQGAFDDVLASQAGASNPAEAIIRLFTSEEEALYYLEGVAAFFDYDTEQMEAVRMKLTDLFDVRLKLAKATKETAKMGIRLDISRLQPDELFPETVDTLWSSERWMH